MHRCLTILTNIPTPYRIPFFNALQTVLKQQGGDLCVLYCARIEPNRQWEVALDLQQYRWKVLPGIHPDLGALYPHINPTVLCELRTLKPNWLLMAGAWNTPTMLLALLRWSTPLAPRIQWNEGHADAVLHSTGTIAKVRQRVLHAYDGFAVPNSRSADFVRAQLNTEPPILRLPNTVDDTLFDALPSLSRSELRAAYGLPQDRLVIATVAQLEDRKGVRELVEAYFSLAQKERARLALALIGEGSLKPELRNCIDSQSQGCVRLLGHLNQVQVRDVLAASDVFILPTKLDPNPLSVIEAAFVGLPLIVTKYAGNAYDVITEGENGYILESASIDSIVKALRVILDVDPSDLLRMGQVSKRVAHRQFCCKAVASSFINDLMMAFPLKN